jgi:Ca2+/H+ antiporter, TMEM165/GDT1 family
MRATDLGLPPGIDFCDPLLMRRAPRAPDALHPCETHPRAQDQDDCDSKDDVDHFPPPARWYSNALRTQLYSLHMAVLNGTLGKKRDQVAMDSLVPALIAALLAASCDKPAWLAAGLSDRARPAPVIAGSIVAQIALMAIGAGAAAALGGVLTPNARGLLAGIALIAAAVGCVLPPRAPRDTLAGWRLGPFLTSAIGIFILGLGERVQFVAFGLAAWGSSPALAGLGAAIGAAIPGIAAATLGEAGWRALPLRTIGWVGAALLGAAGIALALGGLRLV